MSANIVNLLFQNVLSPCRELIAVVQGPNGLLIGKSPCLPVVVPASLCRRPEQRKISPPSSADGIDAWQTT